MLSCGLQSHFVSGIPSRSQSPFSSMAFYSIPPTIKKMAFTCWPVMRIMEETFGKQVDEPVRVVARERLHIRASTLLELFLCLQAAAVSVTSVTWTCFWWLGSSIPPGKLR